MIDLQSQADGDFKFILVYQDHLTKFVRLRPLKSKTAEEVAYHITDIFCELGAPTILQSDNGREFTNSVRIFVCSGYVLFMVYVKHGLLTFSFIIDNQRGCGDVARMPNRPRKAASFSIAGISRTCKP